MQQITIHTVNVWDRLNFSFRDVSLAERVSRRLLGPAEPEGRHTKLTQLIPLWERVARATGRGLGRDSRSAVPGRFPVVQGERRQDWPGKAVAKTAHRVKKTRLYFVIYTRYRLALHIRATLGHSEGGGCVPSWTITPFMCMCDIVSEVVFAQPHTPPPRHSRRRAG